MNHRKELADPFQSTIEKIKTQVIPKYNFDVYIIFFIITIEM